MMRYFFTPGMAKNGVFKVGNILVRGRPQGKNPTSAGSPQIPPTSSCSQKQVINPSITHPTKNLRLTGCSPRAIGYFFPRYPLACVAANYSPLPSPGLLRKNSPSRPPPEGGSPSPKYFIFVLFTPPDLGFTSSRITLPS